MESSIWFTEEQFRNELGICRTTSYKWRKNNLVKWAKVGRKVYILKKSVYELMEQNASDFFTSNESDYGSK